MREYLLGKRQTLDGIQNHIFFFDRIQSVNNLDFEKNPSVAMHRSISSYSAYNGTTSFTVSNLMGILIVTFYSMDTNERWINTKIELSTGIIEAKNQKIESVVGQEIQHWMEQAETAKNNLFEKQKIQARMESLGDRIKDYAIFQDWIDDQKLKNNSSR